MAKKAAVQKKRARTGLLTTLLILALLAGLGFQLHRLRAQVADAEAQKAEITVKKESIEQENEALSGDISEGPTKEKMKEIAREKLGMVAPNERVIIDTSN